MTSGRRIVAVAVLGLATVAPLHARAQSAAAAERLFLDGRALLKQGKIAAGCAKLQASADLEPSVGTLLNLGDCRERLGQTASAWAAFRKAESIARRDEHEAKRRDEAKRRAVALEPALSNLVIEVPGSAPAGLVIKRGEDVVAAGAWNTPVPVDPGTYTITATAPGFAPWRTEVTVLARQPKRAVVIGALTPVPAPAPAAAEVAIVAPAEPPRRAMVVTRPTWSTARGIAVGIAVAGAAAAGTGVYFGMRAQDLEDRANQRCPLATCLDPEGLRLNADARTAADRANALYIAGGASIAAATVLWFVGKPAERTVIAPAISSQSAGIAFAGQF